MPVLVRAPQQVCRLEGKVRGECGEWACSERVAGVWHCVAKQEARHRAEPLLEALELCGVVCIAGPHDASPRGEPGTGSGAATTSTAGRTTGSKPLPTSARAIG